MPFSDEKRKRGCYFCQRQNSPSYTDLATLKKYLTDRVKILPRFRSALCAKHQREIAKNIKYARHLALLPFVPKV
ncbi:30S ribosomal protein S18 [Candidatus Daviesbacteria bacterium RIFCSPHIGHO2_02_FULL_39_12]|uniref:Small ribosomal subunit protein bS18 n=1 Tax=Candidatus Daviesbacteria bacterium RIFCSPHIGHO2_02_FULL_39_12 TaxID=1797770 RepID=A0A1F5J908_9BACT|nr:MAG: 30S ribosomal protein S18 [Candidatus Daviesbacteria bacterium RIFCSPHIGHO2_02_FULL_39_12]